ncbi:MAG: DoxX family protein [Rhodobacteraceae bacterium]|nr:DoxX family protein [Paracoccaceae bacterium]
MSRLAERLDGPVGLLARSLMATLFLLASLSNALDLAGFGSKLAGEGTSAMLAGPVFYLQLFGGLALVLGLWTRPFALALSAFCLASAMIAYSDLATPTDMVMLLKNIALTGGFLVLFLHGPGPWSIDARIANPRPRPATPKI